MTQKEAEIEAAWLLHRRKQTASTRHNLLYDRSLKRRLAGEQNWRCCYCGRRMEIYGPNAATFEHVVPRTYGGKDHEDNLVIACRPCNYDRGCQYRAEHLEALEIMWSSTATAWPASAGRNA